MNVDSAGATPMESITIEPVLANPAINTSTPNAVPSLGPLSAFLGRWSGPGFNTIFRPNSPINQTPLPEPYGTSDNILQLNLTTETLTFSPSLGSVPNRAMLPNQVDIFINAVPYVQTVNDVTTPGQSFGIHFEPGLWASVPATTEPLEGATLARMASIPHGTTILAQGTASTFAGPPSIASVDITPFVTGSSPQNLVPFSSQIATNSGTPRIPQTLPATITQAMLTNPNSVLVDAISGQNIISTTTFSISTQAALPLFGGGTDNIAFLDGDAAAAKPNAQTTQMTATFWIETVQLHSGATFQQIQYTQTVFLNFNGLTWPHVSVATLTQVLPNISITAPNGINFLTAVNNGGISNTSAPIQTSATTVGPNEQFNIQWIDQAVGTCALQTQNGNYLTVVGGGGIGDGGANTDALPIHSDASAVGPWETLALVPQANGTYAIQTSSGFYLTATDGGGLADAVLKTTQTTIGANETLTITAI